MTTKTRYAGQTQVTKTATLAELENILEKYGATSFIAGNHEGDATIAFQIAGLRILIRIPLPEVTETRFTHTPRRGTARHRDAVHAEHQTAIRATWRALLLLVKAKLVAVDQGVTTIEREFLPHILLPSGDTLADVALPEITAAYQRGEVPALIAGTTRRAIEGGN